MLFSLKTYKKEILLYNPGTETLNGRGKGIKVLEVGEEIQLIAKAVEMIRMQLGHSKPALYQAGGIIMSEIVVHR